MTRLAARRALAWLGVGAILFQAILFGWHHHEIAGSSGGAPVVAAADRGAAPSPAAAEDDCEICLALHHLSATPGAFVTIASPPLPAEAPILANFLLPRMPPARGFDARAPPRS